MCKLLTYFHHPQVLQPHHLQSVKSIGRKSLNEKSYIANDVVEAAEDDDNMLAVYTQQNENKNIEINEIDEICKLSFNY